MSRFSLPDLQRHTRQDALLRQIPSDRDTFIRVIDPFVAALEETRQLVDPAEHIRLLGFLGDAWRILGQLVEAQQAIEEALSLSAGDRRVHTANTIRLAEVYRYRNRFDEAADLLLKATSAMSSPDVEAYRDFALQHLGKVYLNAGRFSDARTALELALEIRERKGDASLIASTQEALAFVREQRGAIQ